MAAISLACEDSLSQEEQPSRCDLPSCDPGRKTEIVADNFEGVVGFNADEQLYGISHHIEGTVDGVISALVCNFPDSLKTEGIRVRYSGELKESCGSPKPMFGGQEFYYLHLTDISKLSPTD